MAYPCNGEGLDKSNLMREPEPTYSEVQSLLMEWHKTSGRDFPWRSTRDPYRVLIAEKLLQQTAAGDIVREVYEEFIQKYPTPQKLARADVNAIREIILPLGLHYRSEELRDLGGALVSDHEGMVPASLDELLELPGVGQYCARATLSFALNEDIGIVDTNIARFLHRFYGIEGPIPQNPARKKQLQDLATSLVPSGESREFNFAMLDLCSATCTSTSPKCSECPVQKLCEYGGAIEEGNDGKP